MPDNTVAIIQARLGSSRLPMKSLLTLAGAPLIDWSRDRAGQARLVSSVIVAIPDTPLDEALARHLRTRDREVVRGPEDDVLGRFAKAARMADADYIVRVCADNPLIWGEAIDRLIRFHRKGGFDYSYNHIPRGNLWPDGLGAEIVSRDLLEYIDGKALEKSQREHCLNYIWDNPGQFSIGTFDPEEDWLKRPDLKLDIDSPDDFLRLALLPLRKDMDASEIIAAADGARPD
ncbi:MAG: NTP transferase domain-containing protein [Desulfovibrio sp.]|nr:NTP transferase domain-containing protein [Desulfovibrio sp.]